MSCQHGDMRAASPRCRPNPLGAALLAVVLAAPAGAAFAGELDLSSCPPVAESVDQDALAAAVSAYELGEESAGDLLLAMIEEAEDSPHLSHYAAVVHLDRGDGIQAMNWAEGAVKGMPDCVPALGVLGRSLEAAGKGDEALAVFEHALTVDDAFSLGHEFIADYYFAASDFSKAEPHLRWLKTQHSLDAEAHARWADVQGWLKAYPDAVAGYGQAVQLDAAVMGKARWRHYGDAAFGAGDYDLALKAYQESLSRGEGDDQVPVLTLIALSHTRLEHFDEAAQTYRQLIELEPNVAQHHANLGRSLHASGRTKEAMSPYIRAIDLDPLDDALRMEAAGVISSLETERDVSLALLKPLIDRKALNPEHGLLAAEIMTWDPAHRAESLKLLARIETVDPDAAKLWPLTRQAVIWSPPTSELVPWHEKLAEHFSEDLDVVEHRAYCLSKDPRRMDEAMALLGRVKSQDPSRLQVRLALVELQAQIGDEPHQAMVDEISYLLKELSDQEDAQARLGVSLFVIGEPSAALSALSKCVAMDPTDMRCLVGRAQCLEALDRDDEALAAVKRARAEKPTGADKRKLDGIEARIGRRAAVEEAQALEAAGQWDKAIAAWSKMASAEPNDPDLWVALGAAQAHTKRWKPALASFDKALAVAPAHVGALQGRSGVLVALKRYEAAEQTLLTELKVAPTDDVRRRIELLRLTRELAAVEAELSGGDLGVALEALSRMSAKYPSDGAVATLYAEALSRAKRHSEARDAWDRALSLSPSTPRVLRGAAQTYWVVGPRERAQELLSEARRLSPETEQGDLDRLLLSWTIDLAEEAKDQGDLPKAIHFYGQAYDLAPKTPYVLNGIAGLYWETGQLDLASKYYARCLSLYPDNADAAYGAGETLLLRGLPEVAYRVVANTPPASTDARVKDVVRRASLSRDLTAVEEAWSRGEEAVALSLAEDISRRSPETAEPWHLLGRLHTREGEYLKAVGYYRRAMEVDPSSTRGLYGTIANLQALGEHAEAARLIGMARASDEGGNSRELDHLEAAGWVARGEVLKSRGEMESAFAAYLRALELAPDVPWVLCGMGGLYAQRGQHDEAIFIYNRALELDPQSRQSLVGLASSHTVMGREREAERYLGQLRELEGQSRRVRFLEAEFAVAAGDFDDAVTAYEELLREDPSDPSAARGLVLAYLKAGQAGVALAVAADELPALFDDKDFLKLCAAALRGVSRTDMAVPVYRRVAVTWPSPESSADLESAILGAYIEAAEMARYRGDTREGEALYQEALRRAPDSPEILDALGGAEIEAGNYYEAMDYFEQALEADPQGTWAVIGYANASAATGDSREALRVLGRAWDQSEEPWVGLHRARLLIDAGRYGEADRQLKQVEDVLAEERRIQDTAAELARANGRYINDQAAAERFWSRWVALAAEPVQPHPLEVYEPLPPLPRSQLLAAPRNPEPVAEEAGVQGPLNDVDSTLPLPERAVDLPAPSKEAEEGVNLSELDQLLTELRAAEENRLEDEARARADQERARRQDVDRPALTFDDTQGPVATPQGAMYAPTNTIFEVATAEPYQPRSGRSHAGPYKDSIAPEPLDELSRLERELKKKTASYLVMGAGIDARTGTPGTTALVAAMFDVRMRFNFRPGLGVYAFGTPLVASNIVEAQEGVIVGAGIDASPGPLYLGGEIATSPIGFLGGSQLVGHLRAGTEAIPRLGLGVEVARETVNDSLLSWAGLVDEATGQPFGRVARNRGSLNLRIGLDPRAMLLLGGDLAQYDGVNVDVNQWWQARMGLRFQVWSEGDEKVHAGAEGYAMHFANQLDTFEPRDGGYFSPDLFVTARGRLAYEGLLLDDQLDFEAWGALGVQYTVGEETSNLTPGLRPAVALHLGAEYMLDLGLSLGLKYDFDNAGGVYTRNVGWLFLKKRFGVRG